MISRRTFLRRMIATGVVASVAPQLLKAAVAQEPVVMMESTAHGVLTYEHLQKAYQSTVFGYDEPDLIVVSSDTYKWMRSIFEKLHDDPRYCMEFEAA